MSTPTGRPRGRPRGSLGKRAGSKVAAAAADASTIVDAIKMPELKIMEKRAAARAEALARSRAQAEDVIERSRERAHAISVLQGDKVLRFLKRSERLAWLCDMVAREHTKAVVAKCGEGYEIVELPTDAPKFQAMQLLMDACGDFPSRAAVQIDATGVGDPGPRQVQGPRVVLVAHDNGRGPKPPDAPALELAQGQDRIVDMPEAT